MKVCIAKDGNSVTEHFGHCEGFAVFTIEDGKVVDRKDIPSPGHQPGALPALLKEEGVNAVISGGLGPKAADIFCQHGIEVYLGVTGELEEVIETFVRGELEEGANVCHH
jgi:predicted Fe-Mo cluster-binding NifX family protein